jgi:hypothetical protein
MEIDSKPAIVIGTGPSLKESANLVREAARRGIALTFGINNTYRDFRLDCWIACDPKWHEHYGKVSGNFIKYHWDEDICERFGYRYIEGVWLDGLSTDRNKLSLGHSSGWQALQLAVHFGCSPILLVGFDMTYWRDEPRHYFTDLSDADGEYPAELRKFSLFDKPDKTGLLYDYANIARQCERGEIQPIINCSARTVMEWFPRRELSEFIVG